MKKILMLLALFTLTAYAEEIYATFEVEAEQSADLAFSSSGIVGEMYVEAGTKVKKDQLLAELVNDDLKAMVDISQIALKYAKRDYERQKKVKQHINEAQLDSYAYKYENAEVQLKYQQSLLDKTYLRAPFEGIITRKYIDTGDVVSGQMITEVYTIQSSKERRLIVKFDQKYHAKVKEGDIFTYKVDGDERSHRGTIYKIYPSIDTASRKVIAEVIAENFPVGLFGDGYITAK